MQTTTTSSQNKLSESEALAIFRQGPRRFLDVGHSRLAYYSVGAGPDLVFVHGWPLHAVTFRRILPALARDFRCHLMDLPGTGKTEYDDKTPIGLAEHADTLRRAIDLLGLSRYAFLAHDSGAVFARLAAANDARVSAMVLGDTEIPGHRPWLVEALGALSKVPGGIGLLRFSLRSAAYRRSSLGFGSCFEDPRYVDGEFHDLFVAPLLASKEIMAGQSRLIKNVDFEIVDRLAETHARIAAPVRLIWGDADPIFPVRKVEAVLGQFGGGAELCTIARAKVFAHEDHPEAFVALAKPFLMKHA
jgi:pimeloyl-ACP methyl ester carboxylesterase